MQGFTQYTASTTSAAAMGVPPSTIAEEYIPLWVYSSGTTGTGQTTAGAAFITKGSTSMTTGGTPASANKLHTLSSSWNVSQKFAFEASIYSASGSYTTYAALWDTTASAIVSGSQVSTASTTATLLRSGSFILTPGHVYAVTTWMSGSQNGYITKAYLVALMM